jgi:uridine phosphorylase
MTLNMEPGGEEGIIRPRKGRRDPFVGPDALMVIVPSELDYLIKITEAKEVVFSEMGLYRLYQTECRADVPFTICGPFLGAPHAVIAMEKLIVLGAKRIWVLGWCGSLQPELRIGHILVPTGAISEEGTSPHYPLGAISPESDKRLTQMLEKELERKGFPFSKGAVWTTDAIYRETPSKVKTYQARGILAVEMEISALMTVALYRAVSMAGLLVVSDELFDLKWRHGFSNPQLKEGSRAAGKTLLDLASSCSQAI